MSEPTYFDRFNWDYYFQELEYRRIRKLERLATRVYCDICGKEVSQGWLIKHKKTKICLKNAKLN